VYLKYYLISFKPNEFMINIISFIGNIDIIYILLAYFMVIE